MTLIIFLILVLVAIFVVPLLKIPNTRISTQYLPYTKKEYLMTKAEHEFFRVLQQVVQDKYYIVPQVQLSNLVQVEKSQSWKYALRNKIDRKSVDFVLFNKEYFTSHLVIELDDNSHLRQDRHIRDSFVDSILNKVGIRIIHIKTAFNYNLKEIETMINTNKKPIHILHVDDDQFMLDIYKPLFEKEGYKVTDVSTLDKDFIQQVATINPDLIISDNTRPDISGMEFLKALKSNEHTKSIPFIFLSNVASEQTKYEAKQLGVVAYFVKAEMKPYEVVEKIRTFNGF